VAGEQPRTFVDLIKYEIEVARSHYRRADELLPVKWREQLKPARLMGEIYMKLLAKIEKHHYAVLEKKIKLTFFEKAAVAWHMLRT
jgi:phytoene/squalene synthetase